LKVSFEVPANTFGELINFPPSSYQTQAQAICYDNSMKTIVVFGGAGQTGHEVVREAVGRGYKVRAFDLHRRNLPSYENMDFIQGSVLEPREVLRAIKGCSAVVSELGVKMGSKELLVSEGNKLIIEAMKKAGLKRLITQSAFGALESWPKLPGYLELIAKSPLLKTIYKDKDRMEKIVRLSKLNWTIVRPVRLTNKPEQKVYRFGTDIPLGVNPHCSRADVADFILNELEANRFIHKTVTITY
jgi:putative NADH-flavin reductase